MSVAPPASRRQLVRFAALVALLGVAATCAGVSGPFLVDDNLLIASNASVHELSLANLWQWFSGDFWDVDDAAPQLAPRLGYYRPLVTLSYALDWGLSGGNPVFFHVTNLLLHAAVCALAFFTLLRWTRTAIPALVGAALFALHPTKVETVTWISGRPDLFLTLAVLAAAWGMSLRLGGRRVGWAVEAVATLAAYLAKEHAVVLPLFAAVEVWVARGRRPLDRAELLAMARFGAGQAVVAVAYLGLRAWLLPVLSVDTPSMTAGVRLRVALESWGRLAELAFWPSDLSLSQATVPSAPGVSVDSDLGYLVFGAAFLLLAGTGVGLFRRRRADVAMALAFLLALLAPVSNLVWRGFPHFASARFLYLPSLALAWLVAVLLGGLSARAARWAGALVFAAAVAMAARSVLRAKQFASWDEFWAYEAERSPDSPEVLPGLVSRERRAGRPVRAFRLAALGFRTSGRRYSHLSSRAELQLGLLGSLAALTPDSEPESLRRLAAFAAALETERGTARLELPGRVDVALPEGLHVRRRLVEQRPLLRMYRAELAGRLGDDAGALELARQAVAACPRCAALWRRAATVALRAGARDDAERWLRGPRQRPLEEVTDEQRTWLDVVPLGPEAPVHTPEELLLQAQRAVALGTAGRAYALLDAHRETFLAAGAPAERALAEVATKAGHAEAARKQLARLGLGEEPAATLIAGWQMEAGLVDRPIEEWERDYEDTISELLRAGSAAERAPAPSPSPPP